MKLTGNLKKADNIDTKEGKKEAVKKTGMPLTDDELEKVSGGSWQILSDGSFSWVDDEQNDDSTIFTDSEFSAPNYLQPHR